MTYPEFMRGVSRAFELLAAATLVVGFLSALIRAGQAVRTPGASVGVYKALRTRFSRTILLVLEILVAADLVQTVTIEPTLHNVLVLAVIVLLRTFLSFSMEVEIEGELPWQRGAAPGRERPAPNGGLTAHPPM